MRVLLLYESCTGNTAYGVEVIRRVLSRDGHDCKVERFRDAEPSDLRGFDLYGFATPLNSFAPLAPVWSFLKALPELSGKPAFIFTTGNGYAGVAHRLMARRLRKHGLVVLGHHLMKSADNWPFSRNLTRFMDRLHPMKGEVKRTIRWTKEIAGKAEAVLAGAEVETPAYRLWPTPTLPLALNAVYGGLKLATGKRIIDPDACTLCGRCAEVCPAGAVSMQPGPAFSKACVGCWACFNVCPENALRMGPKLARPATQYRGMSSGKAERVLAKLGY